MTSQPAFNIDKETIRKVGLQLSDAPFNAQITPDARIFKYPGLSGVFIMESDLYGNTMPKGSCFLVFDGVHGLVGKHLLVETLKNASVEDIASMVDINS